MSSLQRIALTITFLAFCFNPARSQAHGESCPDSSSPFKLTDAQRTQANKPLSFLAQTCLRDACGDETNQGLQAVPALIPNPKLRAAIKQEAIKASQGRLMLAEEWRGIAREVYLFDKDKPFGNDGASVAAIVMIDDFFQRLESQSEGKDLEDQDKIMQGLLKKYPKPAQELIQLFRKIEDQTDSRSLPPAAEVVAAAHSAMSAETMKFAKENRVLFGQISSVLLLKPDGKYDTLLKTQSDLVRRSQYEEIRYIRGWIKAFQNPKFQSLVTELAKETPRSFVKLTSVQSLEEFKRTSFSELANSCSERIANYAESLPAKRVIPQLIAATESAKKDVLDYLRIKYPKELYLQIEKRIRETVYLFPDSQEDFLAAFTEYNAESVIRQADFIQKAKATPHGSSFRRAISLAPGEFLGETWQQTLSVCDNFFNQIQQNQMDTADGISVLEDKPGIHPGLPDVIESDIATARDPALMYEVALHEFLHAGDPILRTRVSNMDDLNAMLDSKISVDDYLKKLRTEFHIDARSKKIFEATRNCLDSIHGLPNSFEKLPAYFRTGPFRRMEDYADLALYKSAPKAFNLMCKFAENRPMTENSFLNYISTKLHSPPLFRILHIEFLKKMKLPKSCEEFIKKERPYWDFKDCTFAH